MLVQTNRSSSLPYFFPLKTGLNRLVRPPPESPRWEVACPRTRSDPVCRSCRRRRGGRWRTWTRQSPRRRQNLYDNAHEMKETLGRSLFSKLFYRLRQSVGGGWSTLRPWRIAGLGTPRGLRASVCAQPEKKVVEIFHWAQNVSLFYSPIRFFAQRRDAWRNGSLWSMSLTHYGKRRGHVTRCYPFKKDPPFSSNNHG